MLDNDMLGAVPDRYRQADREPGAVRPSMDDAGVLPCRQVWLSVTTAWEQISALASVEGGEPLVDSNTGLLGNSNCTGRPVFF